MNTNLMKIIQFSPFMRLISDELCIKSSFVLAYDVFSKCSKDTFLVLTVKLYSFNQREKKT